jgi:hypothetical protein
VKLWISTPCANGLLYNGYVGSLLHCANRALSEGLLEDFRVSLPGKESLIPRGRNTEAMSFMEAGFTHLLSIDADIVFSWENFRRIISHDVDIVGGAYPLKNFPVVMNFNPLQDKGTELIKTQRGFDYEAWTAYVNKYADPDSGLAEVRHVPTGFMCVRRAVFAKLSHIVPHYWTFSPDGGGSKEFCDFYYAGVAKQEYLSEDWSFCELARANGFKIYLDTKITLGHIGYWEFRLGQVFGEVQT